MYIASWSGGKDSTATIILAHENNEPLDVILFSEVMFDENISGELPKHMEFVYRCKKIFEEWGYRVEILRSKETFMSCFYHTIKKSKNPERNGMYNGFPMVKACTIQQRCKTNPIRDWEYENYDCIYSTFYVGICANEKSRLKSLNEGKNKPKPHRYESLLAKYGYTEKDCFELCKKYDMLSPYYKTHKRGGCWFCPNAGDDELRELRTEHRDLWDKLLELETVPNTVGKIWNGLRNISIHDKEKQFAEEDKVKELKKN